MFNDQTTPKPTPRGVGLEELGLPSIPPSQAPSAASPVGKRKSARPKLSVLAKPHAAMPSATLDASCGLGLDVHLPPKASEADSAVVTGPHWRPAVSDSQPEEAHSPEGSNDAPSPTSVHSLDTSPPPVDYDRQLLRMIDAWPSLSVGVRDAIVAMAEASLDRA